MGLLRLVRGVFGCGGDRVDFLSHRDIELRLCRLDDSYPSIEIKEGEEIE